MNCLFFFSIQTNGAICYINTVITHFCDKACSIIAAAMDILLLPCCMWHHSFCFFLDAACSLHIDIDIFSTIFFHKHSDLLFSPYSLLAYHFRANWFHIIEFLKISSWYLSWESNLIILLINKQAFPKRWHEDEIWRPSFAILSRNHSIKVQSKTKIKKYVNNHHDDAINRWEIAFGGYVTECYPCRISSL